MALLLACLLCWCAAGAMAEDTVTLTLRADDDWAYDIYPNGYTMSWGERIQFYKHEGPYIITGAKERVDTPLEFHANAYDEATGRAKTESGQHVSYDVTFQNLWMMLHNRSCALVQFGAQEGQAKNCSIILRLRLSGTQNGMETSPYPVFHDAFSDGSSAAKICVQQSDGSMNLYCGAPVDRNITLYANGKTITSENAASYSNMTVNAEQSAPTDLIRRPGKPATDTAEGMKEYWECPTCATLYADAAGLRATTLDALILPRLVRTDGLPQTGDTSRPAAWLALLGACCAGLWCLTRRRG